MATVRIDYGKRGILLNIPNADIIEPKDIKPLANPQIELIKKLDYPDYGANLSELVKGKKTVAIAHTDITRATPNNIIIPPLLSELERHGIKREDITLVNMTGSHRPQSRKELISMLGTMIVDSYRIVQHNSFDKSTLTYVGDIENYPLYANTEFINADVQICTGFIEPHFFAGFSGGPKAILPGISDIDTIMRNHNAQRIGNSNSTWGITDGNPVWENIRAGARLVNPDLLINVALNKEAEIAEIFVGEWEKTHKKGYSFVQENAMYKVDKLYDTVITTNSGYPLDMNLYQCVKGMSVASQIVKENGTIIMAGECSDGIPRGSHYHKILKMGQNPSQLLEKILSFEETIPEQWQVQIQMLIQKKAKVYIYSDKLSDEDISDSLLTRCEDIEELACSCGGSIAIIPQGPQVIPYIKE